MNLINREKLDQFIDQEVLGRFNLDRLSKIKQLNILDILRFKNPYLYRAKLLNTPESIVRSIIDAYVSSQEETIFGNRLEELAIYVGKEVFGAEKLPQSNLGNPDMLMTRDNITYFVEIKSGPNWGNSSQIGKLKLMFKRIREELRLEGKNLEEYKMVNGCIYGKTNSLQKDEDSDKQYHKICGQAFWELVSGDKEFYTDFITPLAKDAEQKNSEYLELYDESIIAASQAFTQRFVVNNRVDWKQIIEYTSKNLSE